MRIDAFSVKAHKCSLRRPHFRSQNQRVLGAGIATDLQNYGVGESRLLELAEEGISFLCSGDSRKPVGFVGASFMRQGL